MGRHVRRGPGPSSTLITTDHAGNVVGVDPHKRTLTATVVDLRAAATSAYAQRSAPWRTPPATTTPGRRTPTPAPDHPRAIRTLWRAWCRIVWRCWQDRMPYDPARHRAFQKHVTVTIPTPSGQPTVDLAAT